MTKCDYCAEFIQNLDEAFGGEDGRELFCSDECRNQAEQDRAIARAEARSDWR